MKFNQLSKVAILSLFSLGLAATPALAASSSDAKSEMTKVTKEKSGKLIVKQDKLKTKPSTSLAKTSKAKLKTKKSLVKAPKMSNQMVNINKANKKQLISALSGVGAKKAQAIIDYRKKHGAFKSTKELLKVKGIGAKILAKNKSNIMLTGAAIKNSKPTTAKNTAKAKVKKISS